MAVQQGTALAWFYALITILGGRLTSLFFTLSSLPFLFEWEGEVEEVCIVFSADKGLESKVILTDFNDVLISPTWSPKSRISKKSGRHKTVTVHAILLNRADHEYESTVTISWARANSCCKRKDRDNTDVPVTVLSKEKNCN